MGSAALPLFKPQWAYATPDGYRDEPYLIPFQFTIPGDGSLVRSLPWQMDDDVPFFIRGIIFPIVGVHESEDDGTTFNAPGLVRIWDSHGNPLSKGLVLGLGSWASSGFPVDGVGLNAFGFPIEPESECAPGGVILFDFQLTTNAQAATVDFPVFGADIIFTAGLMGTIGNGFTVALLDPGAPNVALSMALVGGVDVQITLATDGGGAIISTYADVVNFVNSNPSLIPAPAPYAAYPILIAALDGTGTTVIGAHAQTPLTGGAASGPQTVAGTIIGVKRFKECL